jgi:bifunctional non-homologous end joining protein LigD
MATDANAPDERVVGGRSIRFTHPDKVLYPETGTTKADVLEYFERIAPLLIPLVENRPATRKRWINGTDHEPFFHKNLGDDTPDWVKRHDIQHEHRVNSYPLVNDVATLGWFAQSNVLEIHVPQWRFGPRGAMLNPDRLVFDLDPGSGVALPECAEVAKLIRPRLTALGLEPWPVTSGSKGIHLYADLDGSRSSNEAVSLARDLAKVIENERPDLVTSNIRKVNRDGRVFVDWSQNNQSKTTVSPYSLRGRSRPMVAAPREWPELDDPLLAQLDYETVLRRAGL